MVCTMDRVDWATGRDAVVVLFLEELSDFAVEITDPAASHIHIGDFRYGADIKNINLRITHCFSINGLCFWSDCRFKVLRITWIHKSCVNTKTSERNIELRKCSTV